MQNSINAPQKRRTAIYTRVSTADQKNGLDRMMKAVESEEIETVVVFALIRA